MTAAALLVVSGSGARPGGSAETVNIVTSPTASSGGAYYAADKKCQATVIMLHPIGEGKSSKVPEWKKLAESLQKAGYSVLTFDFRGHGDSTEITQPKDFWSKPQNIANVKTKNKEEIDVKDYIKQGSAYLPILVNDIAAARSYLDRRNDNSKDCNTSSIIVIGADNGDAQRRLDVFGAEPDQHNTPAGPQPAHERGVRQEARKGMTSSGAVFLSISPSLDKAAKYRCRRS